MPALDADDPAPGARAHDGADLECPDRGRHDVSVGACEFIGDGDDGASRGLDRVTLALCVTNEVPADDPSGELLHHELAGMTAAVRADVDDQRLVFHLAAQVAVEV